MNFNGSKMENSLVSATQEEMNNLSVIEELKGVFQEESVNYGKLNVVLGYHFNTRHPSEESVKYTRYLLLQNSSKSAQIAFSVSEYIEGEKEYSLVSHLINEEKDDGTKVLTQSILKEQQLVVEEVSLDIESYERKFEISEIIEDEHFIPFEMPISATAWGGPDFCVIGYEHCGPGCGIGLNRGGGTPVNGTDVCCRGHDACYANFGADDPCCDNEFLICLQSESSATAVGARAYFSSNASNCV